MNSNRVLNLPVPLTLLEPVRLKELTDLVSGVSTVMGSTYIQDETGAVSSPLISRLTGTYTPEEFGSIGNGTTNDALNFQKAITAATNAHKELRLTPGKTYYYSGSDPTIALPSHGKNFRLIGYGATIKTDGSQFRTGLRIANTTAVTRQDETRKVLIEGVTIDQMGLANALYGIDAVGSAHVTIRDVSFQSGSESATPNYAGYVPLHFAQKTTSDPTTGGFWNRVENCDFNGGSIAGPFGIQIEGGNNALDITKCTFANLDKAIQFQRAQTGNDSDSAVIANGVRIDNNDFEAVNYGIYVQGTSGYSSIKGLLVHHNRLESIGNFFFNYILDLDNTNCPVIGPNYISSGEFAKYIVNPNGLKIDVRDEFIGKITFDPAMLNAGVSRPETGNTVIIVPANVGDYVTLQSNSNMQGILLDGYVSSLNTITPILTNPTSGNINLGSITLLVRVRPNY